MSEKSKILQLCIRERANASGNVILNSGAFNMKNYVYIELERNQQVVNFT